MFFFLIVLTCVCARYAYLKVRLCVCVCPFVSSSVCIFVFVVYVFLHACVQNCVYFGVCVRVFRVLHEFTLTQHTKVCKAASVSPLYSPRWCTAKPFLTNYFHNKSSLSLLNYGACEGASSVSVPLVTDPEITVVTQHGQTLLRRNQDCKETV